MNLRSRVTLLAALAICSSVTIAAALVYAAEESDLRSQVDADLALRASEIAADLVASGDPDAALRPRFGAQIAYAQVVSSGGQVVPLAPGTPELPIDGRVTEVAAGTRSRFLDSIEVQGVQLRVLTVPLRQGEALQVARPVEELRVHLLRMTTILGGVALSGLGLAVILGRMVANAALRPVTGLVATTEKVARTRDPAHRIEPVGNPELDRLATSINAMLAALEHAQESQRRLLADASHELQTPLTSLRTDLEVFTKGSLAPAARQRLGAEIIDQIDDLSLLVSNLVDLARESPDEAQKLEVALDRLAGEAIAWAQRMHGDTEFELTTVPVTVRADPDGVRRLLRNLLDNAARFNSGRQPVRVEVSVGRLSIRDSGPGIDPADRPRIFDRFYRGRGAVPGRGAGLGLAIAAKVAAEQGWSITADNHPAGGAIFTVAFSPCDSSQSRTALLSDSQALSLD